MFGFKKNRGAAAASAAHSTAEEATQSAAAGASTEPGLRQNTETERPEAGDSQPRNYDPIHGDFGPFDADSVDYSAFDFSDFAKGGLDLGSVLVPVPHEGEVQVEMGPEGPQMVHVLTAFGRVTPVAFAAPRGEDMWAESVPEVVAGMERDGLEVHVEPGPWGDEVFAEAGDGAMRVFGVSGHRWMLRMTVAGPRDRAPQMAALAREIIARTFVRRGSDPIPAGSPLPVQIPAAMAEELQKQMALRAQQEAQGGAEQTHSTQQEADRG